MRCPVTVDLHSAVRTAVDEARRLATEAEATEPDFFAAEYWFSEKPNDPVVAFIAAWSPRRALAMCDWADDVLRRHVGYVIPHGYDGAGKANCRLCNGYEFPCTEVALVAAAFGVETGETE